MSAALIGQRIRARRSELKITQTALAARIGVSPSYLNLIEHNRRSIAGALLHRLAEALGLDSRALAGTEESRLIAELAEIAADPVFGGALSPPAARDFVAGDPNAARLLLTVYRAYRDARAHRDLVSERLGEQSFLGEASRQIVSLITTIRSFSGILRDYGDLSETERHRFAGTIAGESERLARLATEMFDFLSGRGARSPHPSAAEEVEDFFSDNANHFPELEAGAARLLDRIGGAASAGIAALAAYLSARHGVR
ncbi:MAG: helix-turn-helix domain-containing protein, partial [Xanthobacteraceae bacterium]